MSSIKKLSPLLISKIAAGEVIERPAYAVKELIENAIDAKADTIRIDIEKSGLQKISVSDNGVGMNREDLEMSFLPHTTSKLHTVNELHSIKSKGFRGEALSSIAAISNLIIQSRTQETAGGNQIEVAKGKIQEIKPIGMPVGTTVIVENLFSPVPARKKFLRSLATEFRHILDIVVDQALAHPDIRFFLTHNKKTILDIPKHTTFEERTQNLLGNTLFTNLIPINYTESYVGISGFISKPQLSSTTTKQYFFVNNRRVTDTKISQIIKETYGTLLDPHSHPIVVLFFSIPHEMIDINVHPRKEKIHFHNQEMVLNALQESITTTLQTKNLTFHDKRWQKSTFQTENFLIRDGSTNTYAGTVLKNDVETWIIEDKKRLEIPKDISQIHDMYLVMQSANGILLIDQHAAHERVLYEEFAAAFKKRKQFTDKYLLPKIVLLDLSPVDAEVIRENIDQLQSLGFDIGEFANNTFKISAVPTLFRDRNITELILEMIADLSQDKHVKDIDMRSHRMLTYLACRSAIKAGDTLTPDEQKELLQKLSSCKTQFTCPHGRPTQVEISLKELGKMFKRT